MLNLIPFTDSNATSPRPRALADEQNIYVVYGGTRGRIYVSQCAINITSAPCNESVITDIVTSVPGVNSSLIVLQWRERAIGLFNDQLLVVARFQSLNNTLSLFACSLANLSSCQYFPMGVPWMRDVGYVPVLVVDEPGERLIAFSSDLSSQTLAGWVCSLAVGTFGQCVYVNVGEMVLPGQSGTGLTPNVLRVGNTLVVVTHPFLGGFYMYTCAMDLSSCSVELLIPTDIFMAVPDIEINPLTGDVQIVIWRAGVTTQLALLNCGPTAANCTIAGLIPAYEPDGSTAPSLLYDQVHNWTMVLSQQSNAAILSRCPLAAVSASSFDPNACELYVLVDSNVFSLTGLFIDDDLITIGATFPSFYLSASVASTSCPIVAGQSIVSPLGNSITVAEGAVFAVDTRNAYGFRVGCAVANVTVRNAQGALLASTYDYLQNTVAISSIGTVAGTIQLSFDLDGQPMLSSPLDVIVNPDVADPTTTVVYGDALAGFSTDVTTAIFVQLRDKYGNNRNAGNGTFDVVSSSLTSGVATVVVGVSLVSPGLFQLSVYVVQPGIYTLAVLVADQSIGRVFLIPVSSRCPAGSFAPTPTDICSPCPLDTYSASLGASACTLCPRLSSTRGEVGSNAATDCTCLPGSYSLEGAGTPCTTCPRHATCAGGHVLPSALPGFDSVTPTEFLPCPVASACLGGGVCARGYRGLLCTACIEPAFYQDATGQCSRCRGINKAWFVLPGAALLCVFAAVLYYARRVLMLSVSHRQSFVEFPHGAVSAIVTLQLVGVIGTANLAWPFDVRTYVSGFLVASGLDWQWLGVQCTINSFAARYALSMLLPLALVTLFVLLLWALRSLRLYSVPMPLCLLCFLFLMAPISYVPLVKATLTLVSCRRLPSGTSVLVADGAVRCYTASWLALLPLFVVGAIVYILGIPAVVALAIARYRPEDLSRARRQWVALLPYVRHLAVVAAAAFLFESKALQGGLILFALVASALAYAILEPHFVPMYDRAELGFTGCLVVLVTAAMIFTAGSSAINRAAVVLVAIVLFAVVAGCAGIVAYEIIVAQSGRSGKRLGAQETLVVAAFKDNAADLPSMSGAIERMARLFRSSAAPGPITPSMATERLFASELAQGIGGNNAMAPKPTYVPEEYPIGM